MRVYKKSTEAEILQDLSFRQNFIPCKFQKSSELPFYISDKKQSEIVMIEKIDGDIEFFPIVNNKISTISSEEWVRKLYEPFYTINENEISVVPTHICTLSTTLMINQVRGTATHVNHFGHFVLDELTFLSIFTHLMSESQISFVSKYQKPWQLSLISFFFSHEVSRIVNAYQTPDSLNLIPTGNNGKGIIKKLVILFCPFQVLRILPPRSINTDYSLISNFADTYSKGFRQALSEQIPYSSKQRKICLLSRKKSGNYIKRWHNSEEAITRAASSLNLEVSIIYPEDFDPLSLIIKLRNFKYIFSEPGSGIFLPL